MAQTAKWLRRRSLYIVLLLVPAAVIVTIVLIIPLLYLLYMSFSDKNLLAGASHLVGLSNYLRLFHDDTFIISFWHSLVFTAGSVVGEYAIGLTTALLLYSRLMKRQSIWRALVLLPFVVPIIVSTLTWKWMLTPRYGILNSLFEKLDLHSLDRFWLGDPQVVMLSVILINLWRSFPFYTIVLLAALQTIPEEIFEASVLDGAGPFSQFRFIIIPYIWTISLTIVTLHVILTYDHFDTIWFLTGGGPANFTEVLPTYLYESAFQEFKVGYSSSIAVFMVVSVIAVATVVYLGGKRKD